MTGHPLKQVPSEIIFKGSYQYRPALKDLERNKEHSREQSITLKYLISISNANEVIKQFNYTVTMSILIKACEGSQIQARTKVL